MGEGAYREMDEAAMMKRDFDSKADLAEQICTEDQLSELKEYIEEKIRNW